MLLPIAIFAYSVGRLLRNQSQTHAVTESAQIAHLSATLVEEHFRLGTAFLQSIASRSSFTAAWMEGDQRMVELNLAEAHALRPDFAFLSVFDLDGNLRTIYPPQSNLLGKNFAYRDWYKGVTRQWNPYVSEVYRTSISPYQIVVAIAVPLRDDEGDPIAILMATSAIDTMSRQMVETKLENGWIISLVDQHGHLSARPNIDSQADAVDLNGYEPVKRMQTGGSGYGMFARDGDIFAVRYEPVQPYGWGVLVEQPGSVQHRGVEVVEKRVWLLGFAFLVVGLGVSAFMGSLYNRMETGNRFTHLSIDMFCTAGFDGFFKSLNPSWEKALGFTTQELMAKPYLEFIHPDDHPKTVAEADRLQNREVTFAFENRYRGKDGSYRWFLWNAVSVPEQQLIYAVARDITPRKRVEDALRKSEEQLRLLVNGVRDYAIFILDSSGQVTTWNPGAERIKGYKANEIVGRHFSCFYPSEDIQSGKPARELKEAITKGHYQEEGVRIRKDGSRFWADVVITALYDESGKPYGFSKVTRDISERKQAQQQIEQQNRELELRNREVERATQLKSKFLASMSHELRTPLNAIVGFSDLLAEGTPGQLNDKQKRFVDHIKQGSAHLLQLINDIHSGSFQNRGWPTGPALRRLQGRRCFAGSPVHHPPTGYGKEHQGSADIAERSIPLCGSHSLQANPL